MVLDGLDGRVARMTHTQSAFGAEYDTLSDMVSFGVAPALVIYEWALQGMGKLGWIAAFIYCAGAALRLARFNTNIEVVDKRYFQGLPSPAAAALVAGLVWVMIDNGWTGDEVRWYAFALTIFAGVTMVSNLRYYRGKDINLRKSVPFVMVVAVALAFALVSSYPPGVLFALFLAYALSGYVIAWVIGSIGAKNLRAANSLIYRRHDCDDALLANFPLCRFPHPYRSTGRARSAARQAAPAAAPRALQYPTPTIRVPHARAALPVTGRQPSSGIPSGA